MDVLSCPVLVLNRYFEPVQLTTARRAFVLLYGGSAAAVDDSGETYDFDGWRELPVRDKDDAVPIVAGEIRVPRILHLQRYDRKPKSIVRLSRKNLMIRDNHQCQYCAKSLPLRDLNIDHVIPKSRGGPDSWENLVTSCRSCNLRKSWKTPEEANMKLVRKPMKPRWSPSAQILMSVAQPFSEWDPFLKSA